VWFGEALPADAIDRAEALSKDCDVMLVVGTSGVVYPAALMPRFAHEAGATVVDVNPERDALTANATIFLKGPGGEVLPLLVAAVREHLGD
jgi:NAD-dependent deacetylase